MLNIGLSALLTPQAPLSMALSLQMPTVWAWKHPVSSFLRRDRAFGRGAVVVVVFEVVSSRMEFLAQYILLNH